LKLKSLGNKNQWTGDWNEDSDLWTESWKDEVKAYKDGCK